MVANEAAGFGTKLEHGQRRGVVDIKRGSDEFLDFVVELTPLVGSQLAALDFLAGYLAHVDDKTVDELHVGHFEREEGHRNFLVDGDVFGHTQGKRRLTHGGTGGEDDEVGVLPAARDAVELGELAGNAAESVAASGRLLEHVVSLVDDGVDLGVIVFQVLLRDFEELAFGFLHEFVDVLHVVEGFFLNLAGVGDEFAGQMLLRDDTGVVLDVSGRGDESAELRDVERTAGVVEVTVSAQLFGHGKDVDGFVLDTEALDGFEDNLMAVLVETLGPQDFADFGVGVLLDHQGAEDGFLDFGRLGLEMAGDLVGALAVSGFGRRCIAGHVFLVDN